jgi:dolichol-phosphate mannosyltransferase
MEKLVSVVVPFYNEAENVAPLAAQVDAVFRTLDGFEYEGLYVNDGSTDDTRGQLDAVADAYPRVRPIHLLQNAGQSAALMAGMQRAKGAYIVTLDGDLQNDPMDIPRVLDLLQEYDCVCGYRAERHDSWTRRLSSRVANAVRNLMLQDGIRDTGCGLKGFRIACVRQLVAFNGMHRFLAVFIKKAGFSVGECPVRHHARKHGVSKYGIGNRLWRGIYDLVGVAWLRRRMVVIRVEGEE